MIRKSQTLLNAYKITTASAFSSETRLILNLLTTTIVAPPSNASKWQMGFNLAFKGLNQSPVSNYKNITKAST